MSDAATLDPARSASLLASAGSGKTWQLVSRVLRLLLAGAEPGGILALTFTRKAAVEMRLRLNERLRALATAPDTALPGMLAHIGLTADEALIARARSLYRDLLFTPFPPRAMTLHAFCQELLSRFALEARVPPGFTLHENELELVDRSWRRLQAWLLAEPDAAPARALKTLIDLGFNEFTLRELVQLFLQHRGDWWAYTEGQQDPAAYATQRLRSELGACDAEAALGEVDNAAFGGYVGTLWRWLSQWGNVGSVKAEKLEVALELRGAARLEALADALLTKDGDPYSFQPARKFTEAQRDSLVATHAEVLRRFLSAHDQWTRAQSLRRSEAAFMLGEAALAALREELAREHALGFTELEWHACRLLQGEGVPDWIRYRMDRRIDHLLIDEFQDTSPTQWRMLLPLLEEMAAGDAGRSRSLFIVGDAKQSIYGFRRADPRLLTRATDWMKERLGATSAPLHHSRRSAPAIIDFVNALFDADELGRGIGFTRHDTHRTADWGASSSHRSCRKPPRPPRRVRRFATRCRRRGSPARTCGPRPRRSWSRAGSARWSSPASRSPRSMAATASATATSWSWPARARTCTTSSGASPRTASRSWARRAARCSPRRSHSTSSRCSDCSTRRTAASSSRRCCARRCSAPATRRSRGSRPTSVSTTAPGSRRWAAWPRPATPCSRARTG
jgi:ATP-dependent helicase/nuclease subunit A